MKIANQIPIDLRIFAGEIVTHLRSALDQIVWQLALMNTHVPVNATQFPIAADPTKFNSGQIKSISKEAQDIVYKIQPFHSTEPLHHPLWILNKLANDDKHRLITVTYAHTKGIGIAEMPESGDFQITSRVNPIHDGSELWRIDYPDLTVRVEEIKPIVFLDLCLAIEGNNQILELIPTLYNLGVYVEGVAKRFEPFFNNFPPKNTNA